MALQTWHTSGAGPQPEARLEPEPEPKPAMRDVFEVEDSPGAADEEGSVPNPLAASQDASRTQLVAALAALGGGGDGRDAEAAVDLLASYFDLEAGRSSSRRGSDGSRKKRDKHRPPPLRLPDDPFPPQPARDDAAAGGTSEVIAHAGAPDSRASGPTRHSRDAPARPMTGCRRRTRGSRSRRLRRGRRVVAAVASKYLRESGASRAERLSNGARAHTCAFELQSRTFGPQGRPC